MAYNLTESQKVLLHAIVEYIRENGLPDEFIVSYTNQGAEIIGFHETPPQLSRGALDALAANRLILISRSQYSDSITLLGAAYGAVDSNFNAPDTSFLKHLTPLSDITNLDSEIKARCLPLLSAGPSDPKLWDSATRTAGVILEARLHDVGQIADPSRIGRDLVNDVFGKNGTLAKKIADDGEREGYRDLYAGVVGALRNPSAHHLIDPTPEDGGAFLVFVNLLLKKLDNLR